MGDLARLVATKQGLQPPTEDLDADLAHEVADVPWATFVIVTAVGMDVPDAYATGMAGLSRWLGEHGAKERV